jgi:hypothetical protein
MFERQFCFINYAVVAVVVVAIFGYAKPASAQMLRNGLGDATTIVSPDRTVSASGNPNAIGNFSNRSSQQDTGAFATRHMRSGESSGIGGSYLGTTNVTSESSPARSGRISITDVRALIPTSSVTDTTTQLFSNAMNKPFSTTIPALRPDISTQWNATSVNFGSPNAAPSTINFFAGHKRMSEGRSFSENLSLPAFGSY